jgi:hypothetical protein
LQAGNSGRAIATSSNGRFAIGKGPESAERCRHA